MKATFLAELPEGYDERTRIALHEKTNTLYIAHPNHPVRFYDEKVSQWVVLDMHITEVKNA
jgi:hypothetical protein